MPDPAEKFKITRHFDASPEDLFDAWIDPDTARKWLFVTPGFEDRRRVEMDTRVGGRYVLTNEMDGQELTGVGEYLEIDRPRRLVFTFAITQFGPQADRIVIEIQPDGDGCLLTLTHDLLPVEHHDAIRSGWGKMFDVLARLLA